VSSKPKSSAWLVLALLLGACTGETGVLLHLESASGVGVSSLSLRVATDWLDGGAEQQLPSAGGPPKLPGTFFVRLPAVQSHVTITLSGLDSAGNPLAATTTVDVAPHHKVDVSLTLGCAPIDGGPCGSSFTAQPSGYSGILLAVWGSGPTDIYVVGDAILHSTGQGVWTKEDLPPMAGTLTSVWGSGPNDVYAVGPGATLLHRSNGGAWAQVSISALTTQGLNGVWGSGPADVYVVGDSATILHFDGTSWSPSAVSLVTGGDMALPYTASLVAVAGTGPNQVFAASKGAGVPGMPTILHSTGGASPWAMVYKFAGNPFTSLWVDASTGEAFAPNNLGTVILRNTGSSPTDWKIDTQPNPVPLYGIWGSSSNDVYCVGDRGTILHRGADATWAPQESGTSSRLNGVWGSDAADVYVVGANGTILHRP
jgi:hypothetical protein